MRHYPAHRSRQSSYAPPVTRHLVAGAQRGPLVRLGMDLVAFGYRTAGFAIVCRWMEGQTTVAGRRQLQEGFHAAFSVAGAARGVGDRAWLGPFAGGTRERRWWCDRVRSADYL